MNKKILILLVTLVSCLSILVGCSSVNKTNSSNNPNGFISNTGTQGSPLGVTINVSEAQTSSSTGGELDRTNLKQVLAEIRPAVVEVYGQLSTGISAGSGVVIGISNEDSTPKYSYIATCHHVIEGAQTVSVKTISGEEYLATLVGSDPDSDLCVMKVEASLKTAQIYNNSDNLEVGEEVVAIGNPLGTLGGTVTSGIISATSREITVGDEKMTLLQTDASVNSGNSGGGLFTKTGYLVGIVNAKCSGSINSSVEGLGFAIPSNTLIDISSKLINTATTTTPGYIEGKYVLGCTLSNQLSRFGYQYYVIVSALDSSGSMAKSGIQTGDIVESVVWNNETYTVTNSTALVEYIKSIKFNIGDTIIFNIIRNSTSKSITVTISQYIYGD